MLERLANVIYWTTSTLAVLAALFLAWDVHAGWDHPFVLVPGIIIVSAIYLIGRAVRYVLAER